MMRGPQLSAVIIKMCLKVSLIGLLGAVQRLYFGIILLYYHPCQFRLKTRVPIVVVEPIKIQK